MYNRREREIIHRQRLAARDWENTKAILTLIVILAFVFQPMIMSFLVLMLIVPVAFLLMIF